MIKKVPGAIAGKESEVKKIDSNILEAPVEGVNLKPGSLRDQIEGQPTLLVFLRHLG